MLVARGPVPKVRPMRPWFGTLVLGSWRMGCSVTPSHDQCSSSQHRSSQTMPPTCFESSCSKSRSCGFAQCALRQIFKKSFFSRRFVSSPFSSKRLSRPFIRFSQPRRSDTNWRNASGSTSRIEISFFSSPHSAFQMTAELPAKPTARTLLLNSCFVSAPRHSGSRALHARRALPLQMRCRCSRKARVVSRAGSGGGIGFVDPPRPVVRRDFGESDFWESSSLSSSESLAGGGFRRRSSSARFSLTSRNALRSMALSEIISSSSRSRKANSRRSLPRYWHS
mmetsp:Transcript_1228/g.3109  ORF Transcript_1228/g.3109 Transcript_1228/m.3109 type:complete len:281 (-) Transcript_1228:3079-3921(-)